MILQAREKNEARQNEARQNEARNEIEREVIDNDKNNLRGDNEPRLDLN